MELTMTYITSSDKKIIEPSFTCFNTGFCVSLHVNGTTFSAKAFSMADRLETKRRKIAESTRNFK